MTQARKAAAVNVVTHGNEWAVRREGTAQAIRVFDTQREAIDFGRTIAQREEVELRIQDRQSRWRDSDSFGSDPASSIDLKH